MITDRSGTITRSASFPYKPVKMIGVFLVSPVAKLFLIEGAITYQVTENDSLGKMKVVVVLSSVNVLGAKRTHTRTSQKPSDLISWRMKSGFTNSGI